MSDGVRHEKIDGGVPTAARLAAWSVHLLTASGAVWALLALAAIDGQRFKLAWGWMALAMLTDALDGPLARRIRVADVLPSIDGALLDNLIDYVNYVVVPAYLVLRAELMPAGTGPAVAGVICLASAFQFVHVEAKTIHGCFRGFPSFWNVVAFYLVLLDSTTLPSRW